MKLVEQAINYLREYLLAIETGVLEYRINLQQSRSVEAVLRELDVVYTTDRPNSPIFPLLFDGSDKRNEYHILKIYVPPINIIGAICGCHINSMI
jgi:hypothetical protein